MVNVNMDSANSVRPIMKHLGGILSCTEYSVLLVQNKSNMIQSKW